ncbi:MAG: fimbria major subunit [Prevotella sp.]|nr:fimbria major subunit [Prevotella sp.]
MYIQSKFKRLGSKLSDFISGRLAVILGYTVLGCMAFCSCSDDSIDINEGNKSLIDDDMIYLNVRIRDVRNSTRGTSSENNFEEGSHDEYSADNIRYFFYDSNGTYYVSGKKVFTGQPSNTNTDNIEYKGDNVTVLGVVGSYYPKYIVTVLNPPANFTAPYYLEDWESSLANENEVGIYQDEKFVMSTTSYYASNRKYNFVTVLEDDDFYESVDDSENTDDTPIVDVYVERLAAKVTLKFDFDDSKNQKIPLNEGTENKRTLYELTQSIAEDNGTGEYESSDEKVYVEFLGWKLNATARHSCIVKNIDTNWTNDDESSSYYLGSGWSWNDAAHYRSYWGKSYNYGKGPYPTSANGNTPSEEADESTWLNDYLKYVNLEDDPDNSPLLDIGESDYCAENTNTVDIIQDKNSSAVTSILLKARICDKYGVPLDMVRYNGELYTEDAYINYVLNFLQQNDELDYYYKVGDNAYKQIDESCVKLSDGGDGKAYIALDFDSEKAPYYDYNHNEINSNIDAVIFTGDANGYKDGEMYYNIPIEHLNNDYDNGLQEANYGIVRNHLYNVTIISLDYLGKGIFNPDEVIVPNPGDSDDKYYLDSRINVLSWRVVDDSEDL